MTPLPSLRFAALLSLAVGLLRATAAAAQEPGPIVSGVVKDTTGAALAGVEVTLPASGIRSVTAGDGRFRVAGLPAGSHTLRLRRIGYRVANVPVAIEGNATPSELAVTLRAIPLELDTVLVQAGRSSLGRNLEGFYERKARGNGRFFTRAELDRTQSSRLTEALRALMPGLNVSPRNTMRSSVRIRQNRCPPLVWLDGAAATAAEFDLDAISPHTVSAIEVYAGPATVPMEFRVNRGLDGCGVIAIWSRNEYIEASVLRARAAEQRRREQRQRGDTGRVHFADEVDEPARIDEGELINPPYPDSLLAFAVPGRVVAEFIVEDNGMVNPASIQLVSATHREFFASVRDALIASKFLPARREGRPVRQVMVLPFDFRPPASRERGATR